MLVITNFKDTCDGPTVQLPNNATINATKTGSIPLSIRLSTHAKKSHVFVRLNSASIISLGQLCDDECIDILDKNDINILKKRHLFYRDTETRQMIYRTYPYQDHWDIALIQSSQDTRQNRIDPMLIQPHSKKFPEGNKKTENSSHGQASTINTFWSIYLLLFQQP